MPLSALPSPTRLGESPRRWDAGMNGFVVFSPITGTLYWHKEYVPSFGIGSGQQRNSLFDSTLFHFTISIELDPLVVSGILFAFFAQAKSLGTRSCFKLGSLSSAPLLSLYSSDELTVCFEETNNPPAICAVFARSFMDTALLKELARQIVQTFASKATGRTEATTPVVSSVALSKSLPEIFRNLPHIALQNIVVWSSFLSSFSMTPL